MFGAGQLLSRDKGACHRSRHRLPYVRKWMQFEETWGAAVCWVAWGGTQLSVSKSTIVLYAASVLTSSEGSVSKTLLGKWLGVSFVFEYTATADEVLEFRFACL